MRLDSGVARRLGRRRPLRPDAGQGDRLGADATPGRRRCSPTRSPGARPRRGHQPRPAGQRAAPSGVPRRARPTPRSSTRTASTTLAAPLADQPRPSVSALAAALALDAAARAESPVLARDSRAAGATCVSQRCSREFDTAHGARSPVPPRGATGSWSTDSTTSSWSKHAPSEVVLDRRRAAGRIRRRALRRPASASTPPSVRSPCGRYRAFSIPAEQAAAGSLLAPMPGTVVRLAVERR